MENGKEIFFVTFWQNAKWSFKEIHGNAYHQLKPLITMSRLIGFSSITTKGNCWLICLALYRALIFGVLCFNVCVNIPRFQKHKFQVDSKTLYSIIVISFNTCALITIAWSVFCDKKILSLLSQLNEITSKTFAYNRFIRRLSLSCLIALVVMFAGLVVFSSLIVYNSFSFDLSYDPLAKLPFLKWTVAPVAMYGGLGQGYAVCSLACFCLYLYFHIKHFNDEIRHRIARYESEYEIQNCIRSVSLTDVVYDLQTKEKMYHKFYSISKCLSRIYSCLYFYFVLYFSVSFCGSLYVLLKETFNNFLMVEILANALSCVIGILVITIPPALISNEGYESAIVVLEFYAAAAKIFKDDETDFTKFQRQVSFFVQQIETLNIGIMCGNFFKIDFKVLLTIVSAIITYFLLVLSFDISVSQNCVHSIESMNLTVGHF